MSKIFLSYRRQDSAYVARLICERLRAHFGADAVFMDIDCIPFGVNFREHLTAALDQCGILLAVIGPRWSGETGTLRRIDDPRDFVRIEIESALERNLPVVPILIDHARIPDEVDLPPSLARLAYRHALDLDPGRDFDNQIDRLIKGIDPLFPQPHCADEVPSRQPEKRAAVSPTSRGQEPSRKSQSVDAAQRPEAPASPLPQPDGSPIAVDPVPPLRDAAPRGGSRHESAPRHSTDAT